MKWSWICATNNRALTTVREGDAQGTLLPDSTPNPGMSKQGSYPEQNTRKNKWLQ